MIDASFDDLPTVDLFGHLVPGVLGQKGNLAKAVRLWTMLRSLYGDRSVELDDWFSNAQWRDAFLQPGDRTKTIREWIFSAATATDRLQWQQEFVRRYGAASFDLEAVPFQVDDRTLRNDFATLEKLGWLQANGTGSQRRYARRSDRPQLLETAPITEATTGHFIPNDLASVVDQFPTPINGVQRFILDVEYIVAQSISEQVDRLLQQLKQIWQQTPVAPVRLTYRSIRYYGTDFEVITYPVCIYYFQRAPYLFAFGQTPQRLDEGEQDAIDWYDYRLDRICSLTPLSWEEASLPPGWRSNRAVEPLPRLFAEKTPDFVQQEVAAAMGVEIHRPIAPLLLRFDLYFYTNYIADTERAKLFREMTFEQAEKRFQIDPQVSVQGLSLQRWFSDRRHHQSSVFCLAQHRLNDNNVVMRLRAWGANVEVLLPLSLRQQMTKDTQQAWKLYCK